jgi:AcrR family transcriptional regulator
MTKQQPAEVRRTRILDAASSLLVKKGLAATTIEEVASAAGIAKGTIYLYFPSRSELLASLRRRYAVNLARRASSILETGAASDTASVVGAYERLVSDLTIYLLANRRLHHVLFQEAGVSEEETMEPLRDLITNSLQRAMDDGALEAIDSSVLMRFLLDGLHGAITPLFHDRSADRRHTVSQLQKVVRRVLTPVQMIASR